MTRIEFVKPCPLLFPSGLEFPDAAQPPELFPDATDIIRGQPFDAGIINRFADFPGVPVLDELIQGCNIGARADVVFGRDHDMRVPDAPLLTFKYAEPFHIDFWKRIRSN